MANGLSSFEINPELEQAERRRNQPFDHDLGPMSDKNNAFCVGVTFSIFWQSINSKYEVLLMKWLTSSQLQYCLRS